MKNILLLSIILILITSCNEEIPIENTQSSKDHLLAEDIFHNIGINIENAFNFNSNTICPTYLLKNSAPSDEDTIIIDFGNGIPACINNNNIESGKIIIIYDGNYYSEGTTITSSFDNYYLNNSLIQGYITIKNKGKNDDENMVFDYEIEDATINTSIGLINWNAELEKEWVSGDSTLDRSDDIYKITGEANGIGRNDNSFNVDIQEPLKAQISCQTSCIIKEGEAKIYPSGYQERIINYGDSICDCNFEVQHNGTVKPISIY